LADNGCPAKLEWKKVMVSSSKNMLYSKDRGTLPQSDHFQRGTPKMNRRKLLKRLALGNLQNVSFADFVQLVQGFGFSLLRVRGSHHIFDRPDVDELVNIQEVQGQAKPYQIRQFLRLVERYNIRMEGE
jgi:predicted RNA binding protein YcfA (HicA-like mRNA interferase family)